MKPPPIRVYVVWASADVQDIVAVDLPAGATAADAVSGSGLARAHDFDPARMALGIAGRRAAPSTVLADGDRVELCRPLVVDPKEARRRRAIDRPLPRPRQRKKRAAEA
jgi:putative ubiquitin-RnfH superfamily antitoxin RatB of RatAB toxin-antitoxin module